tara:strand:- start:2846 stop:3880 length:1035 start_codon:yes stop_codon:yes gene_type:complete
MMGATGLRTHIWNNNLKSLLLLAGFPLLLSMIAFAAALLIGGVSDGTGGSYSKDGQYVGGGGAIDWGGALEAWPSMLVVSAVVAGIWFVIAWFGHQAMIDAATGAHKVERSDEPELYNLLENLCISRGITMPSLRIIERPEMNAFASGLTEKQYTVTVTRGLMQSLDKDELEAVLAHELSHIRHKDVRLLVISVIFVGIFSFLAQIAFRALFHGAFMRVGSSRRGNGGNAIIIVLIAVAIVAVAYGLAIAIRFALSRKREYMADAGAVELTRNPDAMIGALEKISGHAAIEDAPDGVREMMLENPHTGFAGWFATHPPIEKRIEALIDYAGGERRIPQSAVPQV